MSKFSGQKWRRGKRRNRQETKGPDHDRQNVSVVSQNDHTEFDPKLLSSDDKIPAESKSAGSVEIDKFTSAMQNDRSSTNPNGNGNGKLDGASGALKGGLPSNSKRKLATGGQSVATDGNNPNPHGKVDDREGGGKRLRNRARRSKRLPQANFLGKADRGQKNGPQPAFDGDLNSTQSAGQSSTISNGENAAAPIPARKKRVTRRKGAKSRQRDEAVMRHLRSPITPAPDAAYVPKVEPKTIEKVGINAERTRAETGNTSFQNKPYASPRTNALYAALDLGTNNCRLLIATPQEKGRFRVVDGYSKIVRLGEGLAHSGKLSDNAMNRAIEALKICSEKLISHSISGRRLIATEACRQAENGEHFLSRVKAETGMSLEIIDRETEAYLAAEGCGALMDKKSDAAVLFDIGGGSSELILVNSQGRKKRISDQIVAWTSLPIGVVTLAERHGGAEVNKEVFQRMVDEVRSHLSKFEGRDALARIWKNGKVHLLGTSGTVTTLAGIHLGLPRYERRLVDGLWLAGVEVDKVIKDLLAMDYGQRAASPCIGNERADLVMAGCAILEGIRQFWPSDRLRVADRGLREGMLTQLMDRDSAWLPAKFGRRRGQRYWNQNRSSSNGSDKTSIGKE